MKLIERVSSGSTDRSRWGHCWHRWITIYIFILVDLWHICITILLNSSIYNASTHNSIHLDGSDHGHSRVIWKRTILQINFMSRYSCNIYFLIEIISYSRTTVSSFRTYSSNLYFTFRISIQLWISRFTISIPSELKWFLLLYADDNQRERDNFYLFLVKCISMDFFSILLFSECDVFYLPNQSRASQLSASGSCHLISNRNF